MSSSITLDDPGVRASDVRTTAEQIFITLEDGRTLIVPTDWLPRLKYATRRERENVVISAWGVEWPDVEADATIRGLLAGRKSGENPDCFAFWLRNRKRGKRVTVMDWLALQRKKNRRNVK